MFKVMLKTPEQCHLFSSASIVDFEQVNVG